MGRELIAEWRNVWTTWVPRYTACGMEPYSAGCLTCYLDKLTLLLRLLCTSVRWATVFTAAAAIYFDKLKERRPLEANSCSAVQKYPEFYGPPLFITVFTKAPYLPCPKTDKSSPHLSCSFNFHFNIIFPKYILVFQAVSFPQAYLPKPCVHFFSSLYATCPANLMLFDFVIRIIVGQERPEVPHCAFVSSLLLLPLSW